MMVNWFRIRYTDVLVACRERMSSPGRLARFLVGLTALLLVAMAGKSFAQPAPSFEIRLGVDGETIGEAQPVFIEIDRSRLPAISVREVARRYQKLLDTAEDPAVRVDALHRLSNLQAIAGDELDISPEQEVELYRQAVDSYELIVGSGVYYGRIDELLYQNAKAYAFIGDEESSVKRLKQLLGLYPGSEYALEARFRIAEHAFNRGDYATAEAGYEDVLARDSDNRFSDKAEYMLGWSLFKRDRLGGAAEHFMSVLDRYADRPGGLEELEKVEASVVDDTFRILSIIAAYEGGAEAYERLLADREHPSYEYLLYDRLADFYRVNERYADSVAASTAFIANNPGHSAAPALAEQAVETYISGGFAEEALQAKIAYIDRFGFEERYQTLEPDQQQTLRGYLDQVGRHYYREGQAASGGTTLMAGTGDAQVEGASVGAASRDLYSKAAGYLERWTQLLDNGVRGEQLVLAADAWVRAGELENALPLYEIAGYREGNYEKSADAAYAALMIYRSRLADTPDSPEALAELMDSTERYLRIHFEDSRAAAVRAHAANLLYNQGLEQRAHVMAEPLIHDESATDAERRAAMLVVANVAFNSQQYDAAERYYGTALELMQAGAPLYRQTHEKLTSTLYRRAEVAAAAGQTDVAVAGFLQVAEMNQDADAAMKARYDAANALLAAHRWDEAIAALKDFKGRYRTSELFEPADDKLIHAYAESDRYGEAADALLAQLKRRQMPAAERWKERLAAAQWYETAGRQADARAVYQNYLSSGTGAFGSHDFQQELRWKLAEHARAEGASSASRRYRAIVAAEEQKQEQGEGSDRSRYLASQSALILARQADEAFRNIALTAPLDQSLARKQAALEKAIDAYDEAQQFGLEEAISERTYAIAELYRQLAQDLLASEPPAELTDLQRQQYSLLLEEQAYPFEEEAISLHERNQAMIAERHWNPWIDRSLESLAEIFPARYARDSRWMHWSSEEVVQ